MQYVTKSVESVLRSLGSSRSGLTEKEAATRRLHHGWNELTGKRTSPFRILARQFADFLIYVLIGALVLSLIAAYFEHGALTHESLIEAMAILAILLLNAGLGFVQEYKAEEAIELLKKLTAPSATVRRAGRVEVIPSRELVPGDIVLLETGDRVSADGRVIVESHLEINESTLTGESMAVDKTVDALTKDAAVPADARNMLFSGTLVTRGSAEYVVTATGRATHIGAIAELVSAAEFPETPLRARLRRLGKLVGIGALLLCALMFFVGLAKGLAFFDVLLLSVSLAVSAVPEGLPAVVTIALAIGMRRMAKRHALVRRLDALETLGSVDVICADKTGTITENRMRVVITWVVDGYSEKDAAVALASCNRAILPNIGDPTEIGLLEFAQTLHVKRLPIDEETVPFTSEEKYMVTRHGKTEYIKGAPEKVVKLCKGADAKAVLRKNAELAERGLRVLACAVRQGKKTAFIGLVGMEDPARRSVPGALRVASLAGIRTIMITGDNVDTAASIARQVGIEGQAMEGKDIDALTGAQLARVLKTTSVFARVSPEHKVRILTSLQKSGHIVAMSGDGVNDAPALKQAHVGIAMGKVGTDVAREAGSIVLADDDYATIVAAVSEGRRIYDNIRKFVLFLLRANVAELLFISVSVAIGIPAPYRPLQILWINLMTDSLPALALAMEPAEPDVMRRPPRPAREGLFAGQVGTFLISSMYAFGTAFLFYLWQLSLGVELDHARTATFTLAILLELLLAFSTRSTRPIFQIGLLSNPWMIGAVTVPLALHALLLYTPLGGMFSLVPLGALELGRIALIALAGFAVFEALKLVPRGETNIPLAFFVRRTKDKRP